MPRSNLFFKEIDIRANWDVEQIFDLSIPYTPEPKINWARKVILFCCYLTITTP
jgi:hypothetical protein